MGRHSSSDGNPPTNPAGRWNAARARPQPVAPGGPGEGTDATHYPSTLDDSGHIPLVSGPEVQPPSPPSTATGNVLVRAAEPTQVVPRIRPDVQTPSVADPDSTTTFARVDGTGTSAADT